MKILKESPTRMVLKDYGLTSFALGILFVLIGVGLVLFSWLREIEVLAFGGIFFLVGVYMLATTKMISISLEKGGKCKFSISRIIGGETNECDASDIKELWVERDISTSHGKEKETYYKYWLSFILKDGRKFRFDFGRVTSSMLDLLRSPHEEKMREAKQISDFLDIPLKEIGPPGASEVLGAIKETIEKPFKK